MRRWSIASPFTNQLRIEQTRQEMDYLRTDVLDWLARRRKLDRLRQYQTQLSVLEAAIVTPLANLRAALDGVAETQPTDQLYGECRAFDQRLVLLRRVWTYFRAKFDQRDDPALAPVLAAADEVVWSCYAEVFRNVDPTAPGAPTRGSAPLPFIESRYSPEAVPRDEPPPDVRTTPDDLLLYEHLRRLPIPVIGLPPACVHAPWWLIYLGHEVGHHLQYDLAPEWRLVNGFGRWLGEAAASQPEPTVDAVGSQRWQGWGREIFADVFSVCAMGSPAVHALVELERADRRTMLKPNRPRYPSAMVRLALLAAVACALGVDGNAALAGIQPEAVVAGPPIMDGPRDLCQLARADLALVPKLAAAVLSHSIEGLGTLPELCGCANGKAPASAGSGWAQALLGRAPLFPEPSLPAARLIISGALEAWTELGSLADSGLRDDTRERLRANLLQVLPRSREETTRAAPPETGLDLAALGDELTRLLLRPIPEMAAE